MRNSVKKTLFRIFDALTAPFVLISLFVLKAIRKHGVQNFPVNLRSFLNTGVFPIRDHYYEPQLVYSKEFDAKKIRKLPIDFQLARQVVSLQQLTHSGELKKFAEKGIATRYTFYYDNPSFGRGDSELYYLLIRNLKPKKIIEIGSGYSTLICLEAIRANLTDGHETKLTCIEPYEMEWLESKKEVIVIRERVEKINLEIFNSLEENDILFIDSSHIIRPENDVLFEYMELLPAIKKGVIIHVHDIFSPRHYRAEWLKNEFRFWNEQYLLEAFLYGNPSYEIMYSLNYLKNDAFAATKKILPFINEAAEPASFWMRKLQ